MASPLKGIKVLELGHFIAGPMAGLQLADLGAEVIKIERPGEGDPFRGFQTAAKTQNYSHNFCAFNRNKLSVTLDLNNARGQELLRGMAMKADVVLENFRPGVTRRLGIDYEVLKKTNAGLVYCSIVGFSENGPYKDRPAFDTVGQAISGMLGMFLDPKDPRPPRTHNRRSGERDAGLQRRHRRPVRTRANGNGTARGNYDGGSFHVSDARLFHGVYACRDSARP